MVVNLLLLAPLVLVASLLVGVDSTPQYGYYSNSPKSSRSLSFDNYPPSRSIFSSNNYPTYSQSYPSNNYPTYSQGYGSISNPTYFNDYPSYPNSYSSYSRPFGARSLYKDGKSISDLQVMCNEHTCGVDAQCVQGTVRPRCACRPGFFGDPLTQCIRVECVDDSGCDSRKACVEQHCVDPCKDRCGRNAICDVKHQRAVCTCPPGYTGNPEDKCFDPEEACRPSPCGINMKCFVKNYQAVCACEDGFILGHDSKCRRECESDQECSPQQACRNFKCVNRCSICGKNAICETVTAHHATCKCPANYHGDPYHSCSPECTTDAECPSAKPRCQYNKCVDPCAGACGVNALCELSGINPTCSCPRNMTGNPKTLCKPFEPRDVCEPNPCVTNARCTPGHDNSGAPKPVCNCYPGFFGIGTGSCQQGECELDSQCLDHLACVGFHCIDPCLGNTECGSGGICMARRHIAVCTCADGRITGDALVNCYDTRASAASTRHYIPRHKRNGDEDSKKATANKEREAVEIPEPHINGTTVKISEGKPTTDIRHV